MSRCSTTRQPTAVNLTIVANSVLFVGTLAACSPAQEAVLQTQMAQLAATAVVEAGHAAGTQAAHLAETAQASVQTQASQFQSTTVAQVATEAIGVLTPDGPATAPAPQGPDVATYTVAPGDTLSDIASRFSLAVDSLVRLNQDRYPSLRSDPNHLEVGWVLITATGSGEPVAPAPEPVPTGSPLPAECDGSSVYWVDDFGCKEVAVDVVTEVGYSFACVALDDNPLGYVKYHIVYRGWVITVNGNTVGYGWFVDQEKHEVVIGPAIITDTSAYPECGIPGNP